MKSVLSLTLAISFLASALPAAAQDTTRAVWSLDGRGPALIVSSPVWAARPSMQSPAQTNTGHSAWRDTLIGAGIGAGIGIVLGAVVDRNATCLDASRNIVSGHCEGHYAMTFFGADGAALGALVGFLVHRHVRNAQLTCTRLRPTPRSRENDLRS